MFAPTIDHPDYGILFVAHHRCPHTDAAGERQLVMAALKLIRRLDPDGFEARADTEALRRRLDELAIPAGRQPYSRPMDAIVAAVARVGTPEPPALEELTRLAYERGLARESDAGLLYQRLAVAGEIGRRGEWMRVAVEAEILRRPWIWDLPEDTSEYDPQYY